MPGLPARFSGVSLRSAVLAASVGLVAPAAAQDAGDDEATQLETITVVGDTPKLKDILSPGEVSVVYPDDVKGEHKALPDLLDQIPGVYARRVAGTGQYTTASIRGSSPSQVNIYIDGVPYNTASEAATDLSTIPMSNVERVEVYRGTTPARFSGAPLGGAINIVTKRPDQARSSVSAGARSFGGRQASGSVTAPLDDGTLLLGVDGEKSKGDFRYRKYMLESLRNIVYSNGKTPRQYGYDSLGLSSDRRRQNNNYEKANGLLKWQNDTVFAKWSYNYMERFMPETVSLQDSSYEDTDEPLVVTSQRRRQRVSEHNGAAGWRDTFGDLTLGATGTAMDQSKRYRNLDMVGFQGVGAIWSHYQTRRYGISGDAAYELGKDWALGHRLELRAEHLWETLHADASDREGSDLIDRFARERSTIQAQDTITVRPLGDLEITPIGRLEKLQGPVIGTRLSPLGGAAGDYGWKPSWSLSAKKRLLDGWEVFANTGTYNRYPSFYEIYGDGVYVSPDQNSDKTIQQLKREHGRNIDAGFGWTGALTEDWKAGFRLTYFQRRTEDAITFYQTPIGAKYINSGTTFTRGVEFEGNIAFGDRADLHLAGTIQDGRYVKGTYYTFGAIPAAQRVDGKLKVLTIPDYSANARLNLHFLNGALTTFGELRYTGRVYHAQFAGDAQAYEEPLVTIDLGAHYKFQSGLKISGGVIDVFDDGPKQRFTGLMFHPDPRTDFKWDLRPNVYFPQQGRTLYASAAMTF